jgi:hypothetical protein
MVSNKWQNGIIVAFIVIGKSRENDLHRTLQALLKRLWINWMPNNIIVDNVQVKVNVLR